MAALEVLKGMNIENESAKVIEFLNKNKLNSESSEWTKNVNK